MRCAATNKVAGDQCHNSARSGGRYCHKHTPCNPKRHHMPKTQIFQHDEDVSVITDAADERDFIDSFAQALNSLENGANRKAIAAGFDIVAKLRGYKSDVKERRVLAAGRWPHPSEKPIAEAGDDAEDPA